MIIIIIIMTIVNEKKVYSINLIHFILFYLISSCHHKIVHFLDFLITGGSNAATIASSNRLFNPT